MKIIILAILLSSMLFSNDKVSLQLKWKHSFQFAGFYMAKEKGFYNDIGLDVDIKELKKGIDVVDNVVSGKSNYGLADSSLVYYKLQKKPVIALIPIYDNSPLSLLTTDLSIKSLKDLKGKKAIINSISLRNPSIISMLHLSGLSVDDFNVVNDIFSFDDLLNKKITLFSVYLSNQPYFLKQKHIPYKLFSPINYGLDFYGDILFTSEKELNNHPNRTKKFIEATKKGWDYAFTHIDETINLIHSKYNKKKASIDMIKYEAKILKDFKSKTYTFDKQKIMEIKRLYKIIMKLENNFNYNDFIANKFILTQKEKNFINNHQIKCITTSSWVPFNLKKDNQLSGIAIDYWNLISKGLNLNTKCIAINNFSKVLDSIKNKKADLTISTSITEDRKQYAVFSDPYITFPIVIATKNEVGFLAGLSSIKYEKIAVAKDYTSTKIVQKKYPNLNYIETNTIEDALKLVNEGKAFATLDILPVIAYKINQLKYHNLKISGTTEFKFPVRFMVREDYKELIPMINRVISSISEEDKEKIYQKWISVNLQKGYSKEELNKIIVIASIIVIILILWTTTLFIQISKRKKAEETLKKIALYDKLTSIFNRYKIDLSLQEQIEISKRYQKNLSVIFFDIDEFKKINDSFGHKRGDKVLIEIATLIKTNLRKSDIFGRWGGEEFLIITPENPKEKAYELAEILRQKIENHHFEKIGNITCSFGVSQVDETDSLDSAIGKVDKALYKAKELGRNRVVVN